MEVGVNSFCSLLRRAPPSILRLSGNPRRRKNCRLAQVAIGASGVGNVVDELLPQGQSPARLETVSGRSGSAESE